MDQAQGDRTTTFVPLTPGTHIGSYRLIRELGVGGMGQVFLAEDSRLERRVALKFLSQQFFSKDEFRRRFTREAKSAAKLNHNNIVIIYDVGAIDDRAYIAMEYVDGRTLRQLIDTRALDYNAALSVFEQLCRGLKTAHDNGIIHRDLKPANIMVTENQQVKILDFGLAKGTIDGELTRTGTAIGTVNYMSPEQTQGAETDHRTDIFSIGIILFELATGVNPFVRGHMPATIHAIVYEPIGQISAYNNSLSPSWQVIVEKALGKRPEDRYQSMDELLEDIHRVKSGESITPAAVAQPNVDRSGTTSLAVLHLRNLGPTEDDFLTYGITEDLIVDLGKVGNMRIVPMRRILKYKDSDLELEELARNLNVNLILDGSIMRSDSGVRISAQLVDVSGDDILWSERWEESLDNLPKVKTALATGISAALKVDSSVIRKADVAKTETSNPQAYDLYLKGKFAFRHRKKKADKDQAVEYYNQALELEPAMLAAQVGLAEIYLERLDEDKAIAMLRPALQDAVKRNLKADEAKVRTVLGRSLLLKNEPDEAIEQLQTAIGRFKELNDKSGEMTALRLLMGAFWTVGRADDVLSLEGRFGQLVADGGDSADVVRGLTVLADAYWMKNDMSRCIANNEEALQLARANDMKPEISRSLQSLAKYLCVQSGKKLSVALSYLEEARFISEKLEDAGAIQGIEFSTTIVEFLSGSFRSALDRIDKLLPDLERTNDTLGMVSCYGNKALAGYFMADSALLTSSVRDVLPLMQQQKGNHRESVLAWHHTLQALDEVTRGNLAGSIQLLQEAIDAFRKIEHRDEMAEPLSYLGEYLYLKGDVSAAEKHLKEANEIAVEAKNLEIQVSSGAHLALIDARNGNLDKSKTDLKHLVDISEGHFIEVVARRLYGATLLEVSQDQTDHEEGKRQLIRALALTRKMEYGLEKQRITELLDKHD